eukprot:CAMPEP_0194309904 /NCGR_PEP_ID=MMETSP0171-20130528/6877_1 /TAXON_ID=218684 /ORGANISM="Corethron pennatum, Strain L29A3" /LENGTH=120 /DNA_ID=CAMNT_0039063289 /DNA_START=50 /DNA_END=412 /DNA_ORIENTATION=-
MPNKIHPLVRDLYKRVIVMGYKYPPPEHALLSSGSGELDSPIETGIQYVRRKWKDALRDPSNFTPLYGSRGDDVGGEDNVLLNENELRKSVGRGRAMVREMEGIIRLHKYRAMKQRYSDR